MEKISSGVATGYKKVEDAFVSTFMAKEGETIEEAKARVTAGTEARQAKTQHTPRNLELVAQLSGHYWVSKYLCSTDRKAGSCTAPRIR